MTGERIRRMSENFRPETEVAEQKFLRLDVGTVWAQIVVKPIVYKGRKSSIVYARNTTGRRNAEEKLRKSETKYETLFNGTNIPIFLMKFPEMSIVDVNEAWIRSLGFTRDEVVGKRSDDLGITQYDESIQLMTKS
jgi:PAS domain-containing protein